jgi:hypothetical protein
MYIVLQILDGRALQNQIQSSSRQPDAAELPGGNLVYFTAIWCILWQLGVFYGNLVYFMAIWCILWKFGVFYGNLVYFMPILNMLYQDKSGKPAAQA